jgi:FixJ family two-component response regulator
MEMHPLVVVVDDDELVCRAMERLLNTVGYRVRTFTSPREYLAEHESMEPACVVIDIKMPELDGLQMFAESRTSGFDVPAVFVTGSKDVHAAVGAMKAGAVDLLEKPIDDATLLMAVDAAVLRGEQTRAQWRDLGELWQALESLTAREAQVCALVSSGRLNKQIAARIGTTEKTVKVHRARVMSKLGVRSVAELVRVVDRVLARQTPPSILAEGHHLVNAPRAIEIMKGTLESVQSDATVGIAAPESRWRSPGELRG